MRLLQLMQAKNQLFSAQLETTDAEYRLLSSQYGILASTGKLHQKLASMPDTK